MLICALLLTGTLAWSLYDEVYGMRPWKGYQQSYVKRMERYMTRLNKRGYKSEKEVKESADYQRLDADEKEARDAAKPQQAELDRQVRFIGKQLAALSEAFRDRTCRLVAANRGIETSGGVHGKTEG